MPSQRRGRALSISAVRQRCRASARLSVSSSLRARSACSARTPKAPSCSITSISTEHAVRRPRRGTTGRRHRSPPRARRRRSARGPGDHPADRPRRAPARGLPAARASASRGARIRLAVPRSDQAEAAPGRQSAPDAGARHLFGKLGAPDGGVDQIVQGAAGLESFPKVASTWIKRHHHAVRGDHHQVIRERQGHALQVHRARPAMPRLKHEPSVVSSGCESRAAPGSARRSGG